MAFLGGLLRDRGDLVEAEHWCRIAAEAGHPTAQFNLAAIHFSRAEHSEAEKWLRRAAATGHPTSALLLSIVVQSKGESAEAASWWRAGIAAIKDEQDGANVHRQASNLYSEGMVDDAIRFWQAAASAGFQPSQAALDELPFSSES